MNIKKVLKKYANILKNMQKYAKACENSKQIKHVQFKSMNIYLYLIEKY